MKKKLQDTYANSQPMKKKILELDSVSLRSIQRAAGTSSSCPPEQ
jgi:hypothetical protein